MVTTIDEHCIGKDADRTGSKTPQKPLIASDFTETIARADSIDTGRCKQSNKENYAFITYEPHVSMLNDGYSDPNLIHLIGLFSRFVAHFRFEL